MTIVAAQFNECRPIVWTGRYARITGDSTVFHLRYIEGKLWPVILWEADGRGTCKAVECPAAADLAKSVERAKRFAGGTGAGSFAINEFGQVLVPASDGSGRRYLAGLLTGRLLFENPFCPGELIDLGNDDCLQPGDPWKLPYVGMPYKLRGDGIICFCEGERTTYPPRQDQELIRAIRSIRPTGARFIVNHAGLVLTKCPPEGRSTAEDSWQPVYIGSITRNLWFEKE